MADASLPAGFFDDSLADAKARKVDLKQLADAQLEEDWEQFQEFVAEVEQQDVRDDEQRREEAKEQDAEQTLENMQYVDRYRLALERAAKLEALKKDSKKRRAPEREENDTTRTTDAVEAERTAAHQERDAGEVGSAGGEKERDAATEQLTVQVLKKRRAQAKKAKKLSSDDEGEAFDPCNWRSKAL